MAQQAEIESWKQNPWNKLPTWGKWVAGVVAAFILLGIGGAIAGGSNDDSLKSELADTEAELKTVSDERSEAEDAQREAEQKADAITARKAAIIGAAKSEANNLVGKARAESSTLGGKISSQRSELESLQGEVSETESYLTGAQDEAAKSEITDGTWQAEVDYIPGTYEAEGGGGCYWALLSDVSGELEGIIENGGFNKHQILSITSPYFETRGCGTWHRTG
jgi:hypothetical protein